MIALPYQLDAAQARHDAERRAVLNRSLRRQVIEADDRVRAGRRWTAAALLAGIAVGAGAVLAIEDVVALAHGEMER